MQHDALEDEHLECNQAEAEVVRLRAALDAKPIIGKPYAAGEA